MRPRQAAVAAALVLASGSPSRGPGPSRRAARAVRGRRPGAEGRAPRRGGGRVPARAPGRRARRFRPQQPRHRPPAARRRTRRRRRQFREAIRAGCRAMSRPVSCSGRACSRWAVPREAATALEAAVKLAPREPLARQQLARAYEQAGRPARAPWSSTGSSRELAPQRSRIRVPARPRLPRALRLEPAAAAARWIPAPRGCTRRSATTTGCRASRRWRSGPSAARRRPTRSCRRSTWPWPSSIAEQKRWADARVEIERELALVPESAGARVLLQRVEAEENAR